MPAIPSSIIEPLWDQFAVLLPDHPNMLPLGCHRPRIRDRLVFDKLVRCTERRAAVIAFWMNVSAAIIVVGRLVREGWRRYRWDTRPPRRP